MATPALGEPIASAVMTRLHRGSVRHLKVLLVVVEELSRLCANAPWLGGWPIQGTINDLTCNRTVATYTS